MKKLLIALCAILATFSLVACGSAPKEITNVAVFEDWQLELKDAEVFINDEGKQMLRVNAVYTNNGGEPCYALSSFAVRAFQTGIELDDYNDIDGNESGLIHEINNGASVDIAYVFALPEETETEVLVGTPTADMETIGRRIYLSKE